MVVAWQVEEKAKPACVAPFNSGGYAGPLQDGEVHVRSLPHSTSSTALLPSFASQLARFLGDWLRDLPTSSLYCLLTTVSICLFLHQDLREKIDQRYRVRLILDNLPVTTYDLEDNPESVRPGYEVGYEADGKYYINNHLMFKILVHQTNGQYKRMREQMAEMEAASSVEVSH